MKKLLMVSNGAQLFRRIGASVFALLACVLFSVALLTAHAQNPKPTPGEEKCTVCHVPPGNPPNYQTITIGCSAVEAHMRNNPGDCLGPCPCQVTGTQNP